MQAHSLDIANTVLYKISQNQLASIMAQFTEYSSIGSLEVIF
jgi:hypothetical protein